MTVPAIGNVITVQCDICGAMLPKEPIPDETIDAWHAGNLRIPHIDAPAWVEATKRMVHKAFADDAVTELELFAKVAKR